MTASEKVSLTSGAIAAAEGDDSHVCVIASASAIFQVIWETFRWEDKKPQVPPFG